ncbi:phosphate acyltransferase PlsX [Modicisalibacter tunisiensis]|uniref:Phosphate acyltransferase n=1 Tax=Modicisalibacter tunisiensis TaxID=390637 RepID=A0ABS7X2N4_9GAMM|nr:phosphate acyltransferase PlsX [Modicisalibacter tunisiensis]MBZ9568688.1 phosphate acyltransferase PlsX [Modicisalibacter tunisiensis]
MRIAIDAMGGDQGPRAVVRGAAEALCAHPSLSIRLFGPQVRLEEELSSLPRRYGAVRERMSVHHAGEVIAQSARPSQALRTGGSSSLARMLDDVAAGQADAGVSAGNTGALMALSRRALGMVAGIPRPAITTAIPTRGGGRCYMIDLGANIETTAERLVDFARMADVMARHVDGLEHPRVALLNVGVEATKGPAMVREADERLRRLSSLNYIGFVEGDGLFNGDADVVVCDGFVGNIVLKSSEGLARMLVERFQTTFAAHWGSRLVTLLARPALLRIKRQLDPVRYNGASLLGLAGIVVKSHGRADAQGFAFAVSRAVQEVRRDLPSRLAQALGQSAIPSVACGPGDSGFSARSRPDDFNPER